MYDATDSPLEHLEPSVLNNINSTSEPFSKFLPH